jgi:hypothetical protein
MSDFSKPSSDLFSFRTIKTALNATRHGISSFYKNCHKILIKCTLRLQPVCLYEKIQNNLEPDAKLPDTTIS